ncbi:MAG: glycosyltransferase family 2 protein [bacterium]
MHKLAVLLTCYNRREKTLNCIKSIYNSENIDTSKINIYLVDDGSTDGTSDSVHKLFPDVHIIQGNGSLFWNKGMHLAFRTAAENDYDYYLWVNDDTQIYKNTIKILTDTYQHCKSGNSIIIGSTCDPINIKTITYGGVKRRGFQPFYYDLIYPKNETQIADTFNGNIVLVPRSVFKVVGNLDPYFMHAMGDFDYGLRAKKAGCSLIVAPGFLGQCSRNSQHGKLPYLQRVKKLFSAKGIPFKDWVLLSYRHGGIMWPMWAISPYIRIFINKK